MAITREELSATNWVYQDGATRLLELDTTNGVKIHGAFRVGAGAAITSSNDEINLLDGTVAGTAVASKVLALGTNKNVDVLVVADGGLYLGSGAGTAISATAAELNLTDGSVAANSAASKLAMLDASKFLQSNAHNGTAGTACTVVHYGDGFFMTAVVTVTNAVLTVGNSENLGVGYIVYTLPAGACLIHSAYMSVAISGVTITNDTPDVGLGTVIASGAVTTLDGTATFENILTGQTATDTNGTATVKGAGPTAGAPLEITTGGAHTVHFNAADGWGANTDAAGVINGTVVINYTWMAA